MKKILFSLLLLAAFYSFSQKIDKRNPLVTIRGNVGIPRTTGSMMFRQSFSGIYEANVAVALRLFGNVFAGLGYQNALFKNHKSFVFIRTNTGSLSYNTQIIQHGGFIKFGYDQYVSNTAYLNYSLNSGMLFCQYTGVLADTSLANRPYGALKFSAPYIQPEMSFHFLAGEEQKLSFSLSISYNTLLYKFDPKAPRFNHLADPPIYTKGNRYFMNWINVGLGFNVLLRGKPGASSPATE